jgi:hypothetical protein
MLCAGCGDASEGDGVNGWFLTVDGQEIGDSRAGIALRDFGRFGAFLLRKGVVDGTPVLPPDLVEHAGRPAFVLDAATKRYGRRETVTVGGSILTDPWSPSVMAQTP